MRYLLLLLILISASNAQAFGRTGHLMVCDMAYQMLTDTTKATLDHIIQQSPYQQFKQSCSWADDVNTQQEFKWSAPHHYVNMERGETAVALRHCPPQGCILSAIVDMQKRLKHNPDDWQALLFLAHYVGDLHQPLHISFADDRGGNRTSVYFFGLPNNLHGVWDFALLKQAGYESDHTLEQQLFNRITSEQKALWLQGDILSWANESATLTIELYEDYRPGMLLDEQYLARYQATIEQRLQQAAVRLAYLLESLFN